MNFIGKVTPQIYRYLRATGTTSILQSKPVVNLSLKNLKFDEATFKSLKFSEEEISKAYKEYAKSPYVNSYLREGTPLSERGNEVVACLKQGIQDSEPITGKFYRGLTNCKDEKSVHDFVFNNKGFTSATPEINKNYAETFAIGSKSAVVEFDIKTPTKAFTKNNYEVVFDTKKFTPDKYEIIKTKDGYYKVCEKIEKKLVRPAGITSKFDKGGTIQFGQIEDSYVKINRYFEDEYTYIPKAGKYCGIKRTIPAHWEEEKIMLPHYHIDKLWSRGPGSGTVAVQGVVRESLADPKTCGRVTLDACCIDGKSSPAGFYYKLGFRFTNPGCNEEMQKWLANGGIRKDAPFITGYMYLPKENIEKCLNYGK